MAQPPKKTGTPAVRGRPQGAPGAASGTRSLPAQTNDGRVVSLEAGKALQRVLDTAPHAAVQARVEGPARGVAERALAAASSLELHIAALPISAALVAQRVEELRRMISMTEPRAFGQPVEAGDEVELDLLGYIDGKLFLAQQAGWFDVAANVFLPGLFESLIGIAPPDNAVVQMRLPDHYPVAEHRGQVAAFAITVRRAQKRILPDVDDPIFLQLTSRKATTRAELEAVLVGELTQERARLCVDEAKMQLLRDLYVKVGVDDHVPDELVEDELRRRWKQHIGDALALQGITVEEQKKSLADYSNAAQRSESRRTVWEHRCLEAVADHEGVDATEGDLRLTFARATSKPCSISMQPCRRTSSPASACTERWSCCWVEQRSLSTARPGPSTSSSRPCLQARRGRGRGQLQGAAGLVPQGTRRLFVGSNARRPRRSDRDALRGEPTW